MSKNQEFMFDEKIDGFERKYIEIAVESGLKRGRNPIQTHIQAYFMIHKRLSIKQVLQLSKKYFIKNGRRGFSKVTFYRYLDTMIKFHFLKQENSYYVMNGDIKSIISGATKQILTNYIISIKFFQEMKRILSNLKITEEKDTDFYFMINNRLEELIEYLENYRKVDYFKKYLKNLDNFESKLKPFIEFEEEITLDKIEERIINYLMVSELIFFPEKDYRKIAAYFVTRKRISQSQLRKLTGLSMGYISQIINHLLEVEVVELIDKKIMRQNCYVMNSIPLSHLSRAYGIFRDNLVHYTKYKNLYEEFLEFAIKNPNLKGVKEFEEILKETFDIIPEHTKIIEEFAKIRDLYKK